MINKLVSVGALALLVGSAAVAQNTTQTPVTSAGGGAKIMTTLPADATTITNFYKQSVYDPSDNKIGDISDLLIQKDGKVVAVMIGVGGFLGVGEKDVAIPFDAMRMTNKDNKTYLMVNTTKDALKAAPGFKYDRNKTTWVPENEPGTVGSGGSMKK
ncbi:MAG TPA: PRC-barrel domain-containing protein [Xanthobacteraceae bacterium]|nr:PRC-barrel domain-containing protein [Xanthobacteraceae bacterium]